MEETLDKPSLSKVQRITLVFSTVVLVLVLFFFSGGVNTNGPLENLARKSLDPKVALNNGKPTIYEFYADWCESCRRMAPDLFKLAEEREADIDVVLLNVDNASWQDLVEKYEVYGIPQLVFFNSSGKYQGKVSGVKSLEELKLIFHSLTSVESKNSLKEILQEKDGEIISLLGGKIENRKIINPRSHA